jgi:hypothetical protein
VLDWRHLIGRRPGLPLVFVAIPVQKSVQNTGFFDRYVVHFMLFSHEMTD